MTNTQTSSQLKNGGDTMDQTIQIGSRKYRVQDSSDQKHKTFLLHGPRGACYMVLPFCDRKDRYFVMDQRGGSPFPHVQLKQDAGDQLVVA